MTATNRKATAISNADGSPLILSAPHLAGNYQREAVGTIAKVAGDGDGSVLRFARVRSSDRITSVSILSAALAGATAAVVGFYDTASNGGAIVGSGNQLATTTDIHLGYATKTSLFLGVAAADAEKRVWELLGLSADPSKDYDIAMTLSTAGSAAGSIALYVTYVNGN